MNYVEESDKDYVHHVIGLFNMIRTIPNEGLGRIDYTLLSNLEYESITYFSSQMDSLRAKLGKPARA